MSDESTEWRRGGDPEHPPITCVGEWECRYQGKMIGVYVVVETSPPRGYFKACGDKSDLFALNDGECCEWRYLGPLPGGDPKPGKWARSESCMACGSKTDAHGFCGRCKVTTQEPVSEQPKKGDREEAHEAVRRQTSLLADIGELVEERDTLSAALAEAQAKLAEWKTAVEEHAVVNWNEPALIEADPRKAIGLLVERALDQERDSLRQQFAELEKERDCDVLRGQADAWFKVYEHCKRLGMESVTGNSGIQNVLDFISARLSSPAEPSKWPGDIDILKASAKYMDLRVTALEDRLEKLVAQQERTPGCCLEPPQ